MDGRISLEKSEQSTIKGFKARIRTIERDYQDAIADYKGDFEDWLTRVEEKYGLPAGAIFRPQAMGQQPPPGSWVLNEQSGELYRTPEPESPNGHVAETAPVIADAVPGA